jgi:hypothetical protein
LEGSFKTSVLATTTRCNIPDDSILHSHLIGNLRTHIVYKLLTFGERRDILSHSIEPQIEVCNIETSCPDPHTLFILI